MAYIGNSPGVSSQRSVTTFIATAGQTLFTSSSGYVLGNIEVYQNGVRLDEGVDFTATDAVNVTLVAGATAGDSIKLVAYLPRGLSDGYTKAEADTLLGAKLSSANPSYTGTLTGGTGVVNLGSGQFVKDASGNIGVGTASPIANTNQRSVTINGTSFGRIDFQVSGTTTAYLYSGSSNTNLGTIGSAAIAFDTSSTERMRIDSSGNIGIGTSSPSYKVNAVVTSGTDAFFADANAQSFTGYRIRAGASGQQWAFRGGNTTMALTDVTAGADRVVIDSSGNVGIGTTSIGSNRLAVAGPNATLASFTGNNGNNYILVSDNNGTSTASFGSIGGGNAYMYSNGYSALYAGAAERMRINSSGALMVGKSNPTFGLSAGVVIFPSGSMFIENAESDGISIRRFLGGVQMAFYTSSSTLAGTISSSGSTTAYNTSSDYRLKHDIQPMTSALAKIQSLKPVTYKWNADDSAGEGFIAHELQEVYPGAVTGEKDAVDAEGKPVYQGIDTSFLVATLTAAIQELNAKLDAQAAEIALLKGTN